MLNPMQLKRNNPYAFLFLNGYIVDDLSVLDVLNILLAQGRVTATGNCRVAAPSIELCRFPSSSFVEVNKN